MRRKKIQVREKGRNVAIHCVFSNDLWLRDSGGSKSRLAKAAGAEPSGHMRDQKVHAVVARSTFPSQNAQNTPFSDHLCRKSARSCGTKHISKAKFTKHSNLGALWKLRRGKSARSCGAKHIPKSNCTRHHMLGPLLDVQMSFCVAGARDLPNVSKT